MKKKIVIAGITAAVLLMMITGIVAARKHTGAPVLVVPLEEIISFGGMSENTISGVLTSDVSQKIPFQTGHKVQEIYVKEGDTVSVGDKLIAYDMTLENLSLEMKKLDRDGMELNIKKAERDLEKIKNTKPYTPEIYPEEPEFPQEPEEFPEMPEEPEDFPETEEPEIPEEPVMAEASLTGESMPYMGSGTAEDPYHYLVSQQGSIKGSFLNKMADEQVFFLIEVREGDQSLGNLMKVWGEKITGEDFQADPETEYELKLNILEKQQEEKPIPAFHQLTGENAQEWVRGEGTYEKPYVFLVQRDGSVKGSFFNSMKEAKAVFRIEVRENDQNEGIVIQSWQQNGSFLDDVKEDDVFVIRLEKQGTNPSKPEIPTEPEIPKEPEIPTEPEMPEGPEPTEQPLPEANEQTRKQTGEKLPVVSKTALRTVDYVMKTAGGEMTAEEIKKAIREKEEEIRGYQISLKEIELELKQMEKDLGKQVVTSSLNGIVKTVGNPEEPSMDGSPLLFVAGSEGLYVTGTISEMQRDKIWPGSILNGFSYDDGIGFTAEIQDVSLYPSENNQEMGNQSQYPFTAYVKEAEGLKNEGWVELSPDENADSRKETITLDKMFVRSENGRYYVMTDNGKGRLKKQDVTVSRIVMGYAYEITSGLNLDDKIAFPYGKNVEEGAKTADGNFEDLLR